MKPSSLISLLPILTTLLFLHPIPTVESQTLNPTAEAPSSTNTDFIRTSCNTTLYPEICFSSLSSYAAAVKNDPARLARTAIAISLSRARHVSLFLSNISESDGDQRATSAVEDCRSVVSDAVDNIRNSLREMFRLGEGGESVRFQLSSVQTWMSAALTNEETCTDGFEEVRGGEMRENVCTRVGKVKEVTSNALALVNNYVSTVIN